MILLWARLLSLKFHRHGSWQRRHRIAAAIQIHVCLILLRVWNVSVNLSFIGGNYEIRSDASFRDDTRRMMPSSRTRMLAMSCYNFIKWGTINYERFYFFCILLGSHAFEASHATSMMNKWACYWIKRSPRNVLHTLLLFIRNIFGYVEENEMCAREGREWMKSLRMKKIYIVMVGPTISLE